MPIQRVLNIHKFGILAESQKYDLECIKENKGTKNVLNKKSRNSNRWSCLSQGIVQKMFHIEDDLQLRKLEKEAESLLQKIKFQLNSVDHKCSGLTFTDNWKILEILCQCNTTKVMTESFKLLNSSLCSLPLSRQFVKNLLVLDISMTEMLSRHVRIGEEKIFYLIESISLLTSLLYYHHLVENLTEAYFEQLRDLHHANETLFSMLPRFEDPLLHFHISNVCYLTRMFCCTSTDKVKKESNNVQQCRFLLFSLHLWKSITRDVRLKAEHEHYLQEADLTHVNFGLGNWGTYQVSFQTLAECAKLEFSSLKIFLRLGTRSGYFVQNHKKTHGAHVQDARSINAEANGDVKLRVAIGNMSSWSIETVAMYLVCLCDVTINGLTTEITNAALIGNGETKGFIDYLFVNSPNIVCNWKVQSIAYHLLERVYWLYEHDPMKTETAHVILEKMESVKLRLPRPKQIRSNELSTPIGSLNSKMATNLSIIVLAPNLRVSPKKVGKPSPEARKECEARKVVMRNQRVPMYLAPSRTPKIKPLTGGIREVIVERFHRDMAVEEVRKAIERARDVLEAEMKIEEDATYLFK